MELLQIKNTRTTPLHPSGNPVERMTRTLKEHLTLLVNEDQTDWDLRAQLFLLSYRCLPHSTTGIAPCMLMFGRHLSLPADLEFGTPFHEVVRQCSGEYTQKLRQTLWELHELTRRTVRDVTLQTKRRYDIKATPVDLRSDDVVWLYDPKKRRHRSRKLMTKWEGPYTVVKRLTDVVFQIRRTPKSNIRVVHADRLRLVHSPTPPSTTVS